MIVLIKLLLAHIIGDFFLQPKKWVKEKEQKKLKSDKLYLHVLIHVVLTGIFLWDISLWPIVVTIGITHLIIDATKLLIQKKKTIIIFYRSTTTYYSYFLVLLSLYRKHIQPK